MTDTNNLMLTFFLCYPCETGNHENCRGPGCRCKEEEKHRPNPTERYLEEARKLAREAHCRYCDRFDDPRLKCADDIAIMADAIVEVMLKVREDTKEEAVQILIESVQSIKEKLEE